MGQIVLSNAKVRKSHKTIISFGRGILPGPKLLEINCTAVTALDGLSENRKIVTRAKSQRSEPTLRKFLHIVLTPKYTFGAKKANTGTLSKAEFLILYCVRSMQ